MKYFSFFTLSPFFILLALYGISFSLATISAQTPEPEATEEEESARIIGIKLYGWPYKGAIYDETEIPQLPEVYYPTETGEETARVIRMRTTGPFAYMTLDDNVVFYTRKEISDPETGEKSYQRIPQFRALIPPAWENALLVIFPDAKTKGLYQCIPMDASTGKTPEGMVRLVNGTQDTLGVLAGSEMKVIPPSESVLFQPELQSGSNRFPVQMARRVGDSWQTIYTSNKKMNLDRANLMVVYPSGGRRVQIMNFGDIR